MQRDRGYIADIAESAGLAIEYAEGKSESDFLANRQLQDAIIRRLEVVGEAARRVSCDTRARLPDIPWRSMIGLRNILAHEYGEIDLRIVWDTVTSDLSRIVNAIDRADPG